MEQTLLWLRWIERDDQRIVWARANGRPWKAIAHDLGVERTTAFRMPLVPSFKHPQVSKLDASRSPCPDQTFQMSTGFLHRERLNFNGLRIPY
jgi:hypothetical protein